ncbi:MAG: hypothetical protein D3910_19895, partial [Candidatus Electrothrix sp. ATG2]|nr:hypothetical protein [Candidatus Electrothrix sp. ATG2]
MDCWAIDHARQFSLFVAPPQNGGLAVYLKREGEVMRTLRMYWLFGAIIVMTSSATAGELDLQLESGGVWLSVNDVRIPGDDGTKFDMLDLTGNGPDPYVRVYATYDFNDQHALRLTFAPLTVHGTGRLHEDVRFKDDIFAASLPTKGTYTFNTYRLTYRWTFRDSERWRWGIGATALVRDAEITLEQGDKRQSRDD